MDTSGSELQELAAAAWRTHGAGVSHRAGLEPAAGRCAPRLHRQHRFRNCRQPRSLRRLRPAAARFLQGELPPPRVAGTKASAQNLESRIGSHWLNRIGISAVLIGVSYFLKFAFDNNWIGPAGRVAIGLLAGIAIVVWSESFRRRGYRVFSYSLKAVGIGVLYLSLYAALPGVQPDSGRRGLSS